jgi:3'(2'), 5'-bisphosphate nucleotidase
LAIAQELIQEDINFVSELVRDAGLLAIELRHGIEISWKSGPNDKVTSADLALSQFLVKKLAERFPNDAIISEEDANHARDARNARLWLVDPIDGTDNYIANDGEYSVMIGLIDRQKAVFGWVFAPTADTLFYGGPGYGAFKKHNKETPILLSRRHPLLSDAKARVVIGWRDRKQNPWINELPEVQIIKTGSIGLKVAKVLEDQADLFIHLAGKLKTWDTAGPCAIAIGGNLEVGTLEMDELAFPHDCVVHSGSVIMGCPGSLSWSRSHLKQAPV